MFCSARPYACESAPHLPGVYPPHSQKAGILKHRNVRLSAVIMGLSSALDLVSHEVIDHHRQVAHIAARLCDAMDFGPEEKANLVIASLLHDSGAVSMHERMELLQFDTKNPHKHAEVGYQLLKGFEPFKTAAQFVRHHHVSFNDESGARRKPALLGCHVIHLADRVSVLINKDANVLSQVKGIRHHIRSESGRMFHPDVVDAFMGIASKEVFWLDSVYHDPNTLSIDSGSAIWNIELNQKTLHELTNLFRMIIDFRSPSTAAHSASVAAIFEELGRLVGFSERECRMLRMAGNLHDLGKLSVPVEILDKNGPLTDDEVFLVRSHSFHTYRILDMIGGLDTVNHWASYHHESLDGVGYPFRLASRDLPLGSRVVAVADVFTAITEDRAYRKGMDRKVALNLLKDMAKGGKLDPYIVSLVERNYKDMNDTRSVANEAGVNEFLDMRRLAASAPDA